MKILFITHYADLYGANRSLLALISGLKKYGISSFVIMPEKGAFTAQLEDLEIPYRIFSMKRWVFHQPEKSNLFSRFKHFCKAIAKVIYNRIYFSEINQQVKTWEINLIHTNTIILPHGIFLAKKNKIPHVWHIREFGDLDYKVFPDFGLKYFQKTIFKSDGIIAVGKAVYRHHFKKKHSHHQIIYNGIAKENAFEKLFQKERNNEIFTFAMLGFLTPNKGQTEAIEAFAIVKEKHPNIKMLLAGSGEEKYAEQLKQLINKYNLKEEIIFLGKVKNPFEIYAKAHATLMCSKHEAMGRVTVEAMASGSLVIGFNNAGTSEIIKNNETGFLYKNGKEELAEKMIFAIEHPEKRKQIVEKAFQEAKQKFSEEIYAKQVFEFYQKLKKS